MTVTQFKKVGLEKAIKTLNALKDVGVNTRPIWVDLATFIKAYLGKQFDTEADPTFNRRWKALSPAYAKWKKKRFGSLPKLVLTGAMRNAVKGGAGWFENITDTSLSYGIEGKVYYPVHQYGSAKRNIPARPYMAGLNGEIPGVVFQRFQDLVFKKASEVIK